MDEGNLLHGHTLGELVVIAKEHPRAAECSWVKFDVGRWFGSARRVQLPISAQGAYLNLLFRAWQMPDCGLPADHDTLRTLAGCQPNEWAEICHVVANMFQNLGGRLYSRRLLLCRCELIAKSMAASRAATIRHSTPKEVNDLDANALRAHANAVRPSYSSSSSQEGDGGRGSPLPTEREAKGAHTAVATQVVQEYRMVHAGQFPTAHPGKPVLIRWVIACEAMLAAGRTVAEIRTAWERVYADKWWKAKVTGLDKLRQFWDEGKLEEILGATRRKGLGDYKPGEKIPEAVIRGYA